MSNSFEELVSSLQQAREASKTEASIKQKLVDRIGTGNCIVVGGKVFAVKEEIFYGIPLKTLQEFDIIAEPAP